MTVTHIDHDAAVLQRCAALATDDQPLAPIADLGILTCGSPELLTRSVRSWVAFARHHHRDLRITIVDDSPTAERAHAPRAAARALENELGIRLHFIDPAARSLVAFDLARVAGVDPEVAEFAVAGCPQPRIGIGGGRNLLNLLTQGRRMLGADDDIIAQFAAPLPHALSLWINGDDVPMHTHFFASVSETESRVPVSVNPDALALHEAFVGHSVANVVARLTGPASLRNAHPSLALALQRGPVRIAATALGLVGDCASDCLGFFSLLATGDTAQNVLARPLPLGPSREVLRRPEFPILCQGVYFMTFCHAVDNTLPLPPYFPVGRGEDQVWQKLLHWSVPDSVVAHLPLAVRHRPAGVRQYAPADYLDPCAVFPGNAFLLGLLGTCPEPRPDPGMQIGPDERLAVLGRHLAAVAGDPAKFAAMVHGAWRAYLSHHHSLAAASLASRADYPGWWRAALQEILERLARRLQHDSDIPLEYATRVGPEAIAMLRPDVVRFARLIEAWPQLRAGAAGLSQRLCADPEWLRP